MLTESRDVVFSMRDSAELDPVFVWIQAPSLDVLEQRIRGRGDTDEEALRKRMTTARWEFEQYEQNRKLFEMSLVNENLEDAYSAFRDFIVTKWGLVRGARGRPSARL